jgi:hypothetical protein
MEGTGKVRLNEKRKNESIYGKKVSSRRRRRMDEDENEKKDKKDV